MEPSNVVQNISSVAGPSGARPTFELPNRPVFTGQAAKLCTTPKVKGGTINLKILQACVVTSGIGKPELEKIGQMFTKINDRSANVAHITDIINEKWGPGYVLVTADCLRIDDSDGTRGEFNYPFNDVFFISVMGVAVRNYMRNMYSGVNSACDIISLYLFLYRVTFLESEQQKILRCPRKGSRRQRERYHKTTNCYRR